MKYDLGAIIRDALYKEEKEFYDTLLEKEFDPFAMTEEEREYHEETLAWIKRMENKTEIRSDNPLFYQKRMLELMEDKSTGGPDVSDLKAELARVNEDRAYWIARANALADILESKGYKEEIGLQNHVREEFLVRMVKEEMLIRVRNNDRFISMINDPKVNWKDPKDVVTLIGKVYPALFPQSLGSPLDPDGKEPYWQTYVRFVADRSKENRNWIENRIAVVAAVTKERNERINLGMALIEKTPFYLESIYYDVDASRQIFLDKVLPKAKNLVENEKWLEFRKESAEFVSYFLPKNMGIDLNSIQDEKAKANALSWKAAAELYLRKCAEIQRGIMTVEPSPDCGYTPDPRLRLFAPSSDVTHSSGPGMR